MSKITRPDVEGSVSCGFFNSLRDRKYDASQMSAIFDGIINDGIFATIGTMFAVKAQSGNTITIGVGRAWFNHTWTYNDAILPITCDDAEVLLDRIDAVVLEVNSSDEVRDNCFNIVKGTPSSSPSRPSLTNTERVHQHALCYVYRPAGSTEITQSNITNVIGTDETPLVTGILQTVSLDVLLGQWQDELDRFVASEEAELNSELGRISSDANSFMRNQTESFESWRQNETNEYQIWLEGMQSHMEASVNEVDTWTENEKATILDWFQNMKDQLSEDAAVNLQIQIDEDGIERILMVGLANGNKTFSDDGTVITSVDSASGRTLTKTFSSDFLTCTTVLTDNNGSELGRLVKNFSSDGKNVSSELTIV